MTMVNESLYCFDHLCKRPINYECNILTFIINKNQQVCSNIFIIIKTIQQILGSEESRLKLYAGRMKSTQNRTRNKQQKINSKPKILNQNSYCTRNIRN